MMICAGFRDVLVIKGTHNPHVSQHTVKSKLEHFLVYYESIPVVVKEKFLQAVMVFGVIS